MSIAATQTAPAASPELAACDREPIHVPGTIQPHGVLLALDPADLRVVRASANVGERLGRPLAEVLGRPARAVLGDAVAASLRAAVDDGSVGRGPTTWGAATVPLGDGGERPFEVIAHRAGAALVVELEPTPADDPALSRELYAMVRTFLARLEGEPTAVAACHLAAAEVRRVAGVDRVLIYRFDENWDGRVIAEDRNDALPSYLGLKFPATDIPEQARALYRANRLRLIPDAGYEPIPIVAAEGAGPAADGPLDLSFATLRSVSPLHVEYMRNMGTGSSTSVSILLDGELWGLISLHSREAYLVPFGVRTACDFLGQVLALQVGAKLQKAEFAHRIGRQEAVKRLLTAMSEEDDFVDGLIAHPEVLLAVAAADGAAVCHDGRRERVGQVPGDDEIDAIVAWLGGEGRGDGHAFAADSLARHMPGADAAAFKDLASGLLAAPLSRLHRGYILWFRPEILRTESWGGDPRKDAPAADGRIHPRRSFETWKETVRLKAAPWRPSEVEAADDLRKAILDIVLHRAEEKAQLSAELERSNKELEAFCYSVSHDLRAPFRHIVGYAELLGEEQDASLTAEGRRYLATIVESAQFAGTLVDNLLAFSRMGRSSITPVPVDLGLLAREVVREHQVEVGATRSIDWKLGPLPTVEGDVTMLRLAMTNLISNAVKYTRRVDRAVVEVEGSARDGEAIVHVRDNGIGFDMRHVDKLFGVFQRLHRMEEFEGTGIGLANVRRIMARHGGRAWAVGELGRGATFSIALPQRHDGAQNREVP